MSRVGIRGPSANSTMAATYGMSPTKSRLGAWWTIENACSLASPLETLARGKFARDAAALAKLCDEREIGGLILGLPINMDGSEGPRCQSTRQFARNLEKEAGFALPIAFWDERLSTAAVERLLVEEADMSRARRAQVVDKMAAAYILQGALDALRAAGHGQEA